MTSSWKYWSILAVGLSACGGKQETGSVHVIISGDVGSTGTSTAALVSPPPVGLDAIVKVVLSATGPVSINQTFTTNLTKIDQVFNSLPVGNYVFEATAFDAGDLPLFATVGVPFTVVTHTAPVLNLILQQVRNPGTVVITAPKITAITVDNPGPLPGNLITLQATVEDVIDPDALSLPTFTWTSKCNKPVSPSDSFNGQPTNGQPTNGQPNSFTGVLPASCTSGPCTVTVTATLLSFCTDKEAITFSVSDPNTSTTNGSITSTVKFTVQYSLQGAEVKISYNFFPDILSIATRSNTQPLPGDTISLTAKVNDRDGDALTFDWVDTCQGGLHGTFVFDTLPVLKPYPAITATWTAPAGGPLPFPCTLILDVDDGDGFNSGALNIDVGAPAI